MYFVYDNTNKKHIPHKWNIDKKVSRYTDC